MLNLGQVQFGLGVDTRRLQEATSRVVRFGQAVDRAAQATGNNARRHEAAMRRQEAASVRALQATLRVNEMIRRTAGGNEQAQLIDRTTRAFNRLSQQMTMGQRTTLAYQRANEAFGASMSTVQRRIQALRAAEAQRRQGHTAFGEFLRDMASASVLAVGPLSGVGARVAALGAVANRSGVALAAFIGGVIAAGLVVTKLSTAAVKTAFDIQRIEARLKSTTGAVELAEIEFNNLQRLADVTGIEFVTLADQFTRFQAAAQGTSLEGDKAREIFENMAHAIGNFQLDAVSAEGVFRALEQIMSKGTVAAEEIRQQLGDRLPGAFKAAADAMGVTTAEFNKLLKRGKVASEQFLLPFSQQVRKRLAGDAGDAVDSLRASVNRLTNSYTIFNTEFDRAFGISAAFKSGVEALTSVIRSLGENILVVSAIIGGLAGGLSLLALPSLIRMFISLTAAIRTAAIAFIGLNVAMAANPFLGVLSVAIRLVAIIGGATLAVKLFGSSVAEAATAEDEMKEKSDALIESQEQLGKTVSSTANDFVKAAELKIAAMQHEIAATKSALRAYQILYLEQIRNNDALRLMHENTQKFLVQIDPGSESKESGVGLRMTSVEQGFKNQIDEMNASISEQTDRLEKLKKIRETPIAPGGILDGDENDRAAKAIREATQAIDGLLRANAAMMQGPAVFAAFEKQEEFNKKISAMKDRLTDAGVAADIIKVKIDQYSFALEHNRKISEGVFAGLQQLATGLRDTMVEAFNSTGKALADALVNGKLEADAFVDIVKDMASQIIQQILRLAVINPIMNSLFGGATPLPSLSFGGPGFAKGGAFNNGVRFMAQGDILNKPTLFRTSSGPAIGGEAGTEAVMPLVRSSSGDLGVRAVGGGGSGSQTQVQIFNYTGAPVREERSKSGNREIVKLLIGTVKESVASGGFDGPLTRFGLSPTRRRV
jgi:tape measure domain-containing protein